MKTKYTYIMIPLLIGLFVFSSTAFAQDFAAEDEQGDVEVLESEERIEPDDFGVATWALDFIGAAKCIQRGGPSAWSYWGGGYIYRTGGPSTWWCPVQLPNGVDIWRVRCYYWDDNAGAEMRHWLERYTGTSTTQTLGPAGGVGTGVGATPGWTTASFDPAHIVDNRFGYAIRMQQAAMGPSTRLRGCRISYVRTIGPAGSQIFDDVPPSNVFYPFINNLRRSGITVGCPSPPGQDNYCPGTTVTRGQMAAFLSRGFGLWHGYTTPDP